MTSPGSPSTYLQHVADLERRLTTDDALRRAVGGEFVAMGRLEYYLLRSRGLRDDHLVVDVGCGSGRLACQLAPFPRLRYIGSDVVPRLLTYAGDLCRRPDWQFVHTDGAKIPCADGLADFACFFSVFTHLPQEDIYRYFREAHRVLKPGGLLVMSFLEFRVPLHWNTFIASVDGTREEGHLNQFIERDAIHAWANHAGFEVRGLHGGDTSYIPVPEEIRLEDGSRMIDAGSLGQSVAVLQKRTGSGAKPPSEREPASLGAAPSSPPARPADRPPPASRPDAPIVNVSTRARLTAGGALNVGFVVGGLTPRRVLVRAVGPSLNVFGVHEPLAHPALEIFSGDISHGQNRDGWEGASGVAALAAALGAFPLPANSKDAVLVLELAPGAYSAVVKAAAPADEGDVLLEVYLVD